MSGWLQRVGVAQDSPDTLWSWVAEEEGRIFAWFQLRWRGGRGRMSFLIHPDKRQEFAELRDYIVGTARATRPGVLAVQVRDYHQEMVPLFEDIGFQSRGRSLLLVKHIAVQVLERRMSPVLTRA